MQNPAHTLVVNWDEEGNIEYRDLTTGTEGLVPAGDEVVLRGENGRTVLIYNDPDRSPGSRPGDDAHQDSHTAAG